MRGWHNESYKHALASKGIRTRYYAKRSNMLHVLNTNSATRYAVAHKDLGDDGQNKYLLAKWESPDEKEKIIARRRQEFFQQLNSSGSSSTKSRDAVNSYTAEVDRLKELRLLSDAEAEREYNFAEKEFSSKVKSTLTPREKAKGVIVKTKIEAKQSAVKTELESLFARQDDINAQLNKEIMVGTKSGVNKLTNELKELNEKIAKVKEKGK